MHLYLRVNNQNWFPGTFIVRMLKEQALNFKRAEGFLALIDYAKSEGYPFPFYGYENSYTIVVDPDKYDLDISGMDILK